MKNILSVLLASFLAVLAMPAASFAMNANTEAHFPSVFTLDSLNGASAVWNAMETLAVSKSSKYTTTSLNTSGTFTQNLKVTGFGFSIPSDSVITGIKVKIEKKTVCDTCVTSSVTDRTVSLLKAGVVSGDNKASSSVWSSNDNVSFYGTLNENSDNVSVDLWGNTLTASDINNSDFGIIFSAQTNSNQKVDLSVDEIRITVYYTDNTAPVISEASFVAKNSDDAVDSIVFNSTEAGDVSFDGACADLSAVATIGVNKISLDALEPGDYSDCTVKVVDFADNTSNVLAIRSFSLKALNENSNPFTANVLGALGNTKNDSQLSNEKGAVLGAEKFVFTMFLKVGSHSTVVKIPEIKELQKFLNAKNFGTLIIDGKFGALTKMSVVKFQLANSLVGDGQAGLLTREVLNK